MASDILSALRENVQSVVCQPQASLSSLVYLPAYSSASIDERRLQKNERKLY